MPSVHVLRPGYSWSQDQDVMRANGTATLVRDEDKIILVDTLGPWDSDLLVQLLQEQGVQPPDVNLVVCTHTHPDHVGNMNLFTNSEQHVSGFSVYRDDEYTFHPFIDGVPLSLTSNVRVIPTPGHTLSCVSVVVENVEGMGTVIVAGDLFEKEEDLTDDQLWLEAGSEDEEQQRVNRQKVLEMADYIIPGHGPMFKVQRENPGVENQ